MTTTMNELFFDTETTSLPMWDKPSGHEGQPHLVQLAAIVTTNEHIMNRIISPQGEYQIPEEVVAVHGITTERAEDEGVPLQEVVDEFVAMLDLADLVVAHGLNFDKRILRIQLKRLGLQEEVERLKGFPGLCTMTKSTPVCRIPPTDKMMAAGRKTWKTPNLGEAYAHFTGKTLEGAHDAMVDVQACREIYHCLTGAKDDERST